MIVIPQHLYERLVANGHAPDGTDHVPVIKFFDPAGAATWLITEVSSTDPDQLFGLCDLGMGFPELGYVSLSELKSTKNRLGIPLERDLFFAARYPLSVYAEAARRAERITESETDLADAAKALGQEASPDADPPATT
jgi:hypothetical protein